MSLPSSEPLKPLLNLVERCHTILADAFPHEGTKAIGGSRMFLRGPLMITLKDCVMEIIKEMRDQAVIEGSSNLVVVWVEVTKLLVRIEDQSIKRKTEEIDKAAILLYLVNGTTWNYLCGQVTAEPPHNPQYVRIESMSQLLKRCGWCYKNEKDNDPTRLVQRLYAELKACS